jgi:hypothetical protein
MAKRGWRSANLSPDRRIFFGQGRGDVRSRALAARVTASFGSRGGASLADLLFPLLLPPILLSVTPNSGPIAGGTAVDLAGLHFVAGATVTFNGSPATGVTVLSGSHIACVTPAHAAGAVNVTVTNPDLQSATLVGGYTYSSALVAVANSGVVAATSNDNGLTWTPRSIPSGQYLSMAQAGASGVIVAVGTVHALSSDGGQTWASITLPSASQYNGIAYDGAIFLAYRASSAATSPDGTIWTNHAGTGISHAPHCVLYNGAGLFVIAQNGGVNGIVTTVDGTVLTNRTTPSVSGGYRAPARDGSTIIAVQNSAAGTAGIRSVNAGLNWSGTTIPAGDYRASAFGNGLFVAVGVSACITSPDGVTWTSHAMPVGTWNDVFFSSGQFIAVSNGQCATSPDGVTWTTHDMPGVGIVFNALVAVL